MCTEKQKQGGERDFTSQHSTINYCGTILWWWHSGGLTKESKCLDRAEEKWNEIYFHSLMNHDLTWLSESALWPLTFITPTCTTDRGLLLISVRGREETRIVGDRRKWRWVLLLPGTDLGPALNIQINTIVIKRKDSIRCMINSGLPGWDPKIVQASQPEWQDLFPAEEHHSSRDCRCPIKCKPDSKLEYAYIWANYACF